MDDQVMTVEEFNQRTGGPPPGEVQETDGPGPAEEEVQEADGSEPSEETAQETGGSISLEELGELVAGFATSEDIASLSQTLETIQVSLDQANFGLEQLHADASLTFLAVVLLIGVVLGCGVSFMLAKIWRS